MMRKTGGWKELAAAALLACSFWNMVYPEFTLAGDSYKKETSICGDEDREVEKPGLQEVRNREDYYEILNASDGEVEIRFSFLEERAPERFGTAQGKKERTGRQNMGTG